MPNIWQTTQWNPYQPYRPSWQGGQYTLGRLAGTPSPQYSQPWQAETSQRPKWRTQSNIERWEGIPNKFPDTRRYLTPLWQLEPEPEPLVAPQSTPQRASDYPWEEPLFPPYRIHQEQGTVPTVSLPGESPNSTIAPPQSTVLPNYDYTAYPWEGGDYTGITQVGLPSSAVPVPTIDTTLPLDSGGVDPWGTGESIPSPIVLPSTTDPTFEGSEEGTLPDTATVKPKSVISPTFSIPPIPKGLVDYLTPLSLPEGMTQFSEGGRRFIEWRDEEGRRRVLVIVGNYEAGDDVDVLEWNEAVKKAERNLDIVRGYTYRGVLGKLREEGPSYLITDEMWKAYVERNPAMEGNVKDNASLGQLKEAWALSGKDKPLDKYIGSLFKSDKIPFWFKKKWGMPSGSRGKFPKKSPYSTKPTPWVGPPTPGFLTELTGLKMGAPLEARPTKFASGQLLKRLTPSQMQGVGGYVNWAAGQVSGAPASYEDWLHGSQQLLPRSIPRGTVRWAPSPYRA